MERFDLFMECVWSGNWDKDKKHVGEVDVRSVLPVRDINADGAIPLHVAAWVGHVHIVKELVQLMTQEDLKTINRNGHTALHLAAEKGHVHVVRELPVPLMGEVQDKDGDTALHNAVHSGKVDVVKVLVLLMRQEHMQIKNNAGYTALHLAVNKGNVHIVKEFIRKEEGENNISQDNFERYVPFTTYVTTCDWEKANECRRELDDPCAAVTAVDRRGFDHDNVLHLAARYWHFNVAKELVLLLKKREDDLELKTAEDFLTFGSGITLGVTEEFLMERAKYMVEQHNKTLSSVLEMQNSEGSTALHLAARGNVDIVKELAPLMTQEGLELKDLRGSTSLHQAVMFGNIDIVKELGPLMSKEGLEIKDSHGDTPLNCAVLKGSVNIVKELVQSMRQEGYQVKNNQGLNALHLAIVKGHMHIVRELMLVMRPKALEEKDDQGFTALGHAIGFWKDEDVCEIAKYIAEKNVSVFGIPLGPDDEIPVIQALRWNKWELARYLYSVAPHQLINMSNGSAFICHCLDRKQFDLALDLLHRRPHLAMIVHGRDQTSPMLKLSRMTYAFLSGSQLTRWQRWIYNRLYRDWRSF